MPVSAPQFSIENLCSLLSLDLLNAAPLEITGQNYAKSKITDNFERNVSRSLLQYKRDQNPNEVQCGGTFNPSTREEEAGRTL